VSGAELMAAVDRAVAELFAELDEKLKREAERIKGKRPERDGYRSEEDRLIGSPGRVTDNVSESFPSTPT
jgi:hypothetical protein